MCDSLNNKIKVLEDDVIVYPAHGPGSACGKSMGKETFPPLEFRKDKLRFAGNDKRSIYSFGNGWIICSSSIFFEDARINKNGYDSIDSIIKKILLL